MKNFIETDTKLINKITSTINFKEELNPFTEALEGMYHLQNNNNYAVVFCLQSFEELFIASGIKRFRMCGGSRAIGKLVGSQVPVLCCPVVKSSLGFLKNNQESFLKASLIVLPTTCDWKVKMGDELSRFSALHMMELPHCHGTEKSQKRWYREVKDLSDKLEDISEKKITSNRLLQGIKTIHEAQVVAMKLENLRKEERIPNTVFLLIMGSYFVMDPYTWTKAVEGLLTKINFEKKETELSSRIFLVGAPLIFPNFKLPSVLEELNCSVIGDELCSSSRQFWDSVSIDEKNKENLLKIISDRYYQSCICPSFTPNRERANRILNKFKETKAQGIIYHVLKGCHLYDMERIKLEEFFRKEEIPFLHLETDDGMEDVETLKNRIEVFIDLLKIRRR